MIKLGFSLVCWFFLVSCSSFLRLDEKIDIWSFRLIGGTIFSNPFLVTTKQLHFDTGDLFGKDVIFEGRVSEKGEASTFVVVSDEEGKMLVVVTQVDDAYLIFDRPDFRYIRVLGRLERGKKGLPYILATSIRLASPKDRL